MLIASGHPNTKSTFHRYLTIFKANAYQTRFTAKANGVIEKRQKRVRYDEAQLGRAKLVARLVNRRVSLRPHPSTKEIEGSV